jgi:hypothetical protein
LGSKAARRASFSASLRSFFDSLPVMAGIWRTYLPSIALGYPDQTFKSSLLVGRDLSDAHIASVGVLEVPPIL